MTDNDIVKALECCTNEPTLNCHNCPYEESCNMGRSDMQKAALDLINRQKAEIERLMKHNTEMARKHYSDGIKEFAERLCDGRVSNDPVVIAARCLVKELTEDTV